MKLETAISYMTASAEALDPALRDREVGSFAIDSRDVSAGSLFFALSQPEYRENCFNGDFADSTVFVPDAIAKGAIVCVVRRDRFDEHRELLRDHVDRLVFVDDAIAAFQRLAHGAYLEWGGPVVAITGSAGKTTAKELTAHVLEAGGRKVLRNIKNYNNGLGLPLTVLNLALGGTYDVAVLEMGMSTPNNEIARLCRITPPDVAVELNVLPVHVEHLGSIENVARAKAELVEGMKPGGTAVLNADDSRVAAMASLVSGDVITYGIDEPSAVRASSIKARGFGGMDFILEVPSGSAEVSFPLSGRHSISNALAAAAVGYHFGMSAAEIGAALSSVGAPPQRGEVIEFKAGFTVINDSYNSNPAALMAMVNTLLGAAGPESRKIVVAGEMLELGDSAAEQHRNVGREIAKAGVNILVGVRGLAREMVDAASESRKVEARFSEDSDAAAELVSGMVRSGDVVLIKGSRGVRTEKVVDKLLEHFEVEDKAAAAR